MVGEEEERIADGIQRIWIVRARARTEIADQCGMSQVAISTPDLGAIGGIIGHEVEPPADRYHRLEPNSIVFLYLPWEDISDEPGGRGGLGDFCQGRRAVDLLG